MIRPSDWLRSRVRTPLDGALMCWLTLLVLLFVCAIVRLSIEGEWGGVLDGVVLTVLVTVCHLQYLEVKWWRRGAR